MVSFSERHGYKPTRSRLHQLEEMDDRLRNAIWNVLLERFFVKENVYGVYELVRSVWTEVVGGVLTNCQEITMRSLRSFPPHRW